MAAHTTRTAHPVKGVEMDMCVDEDGGRRQRTKRESDMDATAPGVTQPCASMSVEPSGAASNSHRSREIIRILEVKPTQGQGPVARNRLDDDGIMNCAGLR
jgi:hypothetical protein